jgi:hypothetical protein
MEAQKSVPSYQILIDRLGDDYKSQPEVMKLIEEAKSFASAEGKFSPFFSFDANINRQGDLLLNVYFDEIGELRFDKDVANKTVNSFRADLRSDAEIYYCALQIEGFSAEFSFDLCPGISFRPIGKEDVWRFGGKSGFVSAYPQWIDLRNWICEIKLPIEKKGPNTSDDPLKKLRQANLHQLPAYIALALNLAGCRGVRFFSLYTASASPFLKWGWGTGGAETRVSRLGGRSNLTKSQIVLAQRVFAEFQNLGKVERSFDLFLPLRRLQAASSRNNPADHLIDCVIGLENLLVPDSGESKYKFSVRGAALLPDSLGDAGQRYAAMSALYDKRSAVVHGRTESLDEIEKSCEQAEDILREILLWFLTNGKGLGSRQEIGKLLDRAFIDGGRNVRDGM